MGSWTSDRMLLLLWCCVAICARVALADEARPVNGNNELDGVSVNVGNDTASTGSSFSEGGLNETSTSTESGTESESSASEGDKTTVGIQERPTTLEIVAEEDKDDKHGAPSGANDEDGERMVSASESIADAEGEVSDAAPAVVETGSLGSTSDFYSAKEWENEMAAVAKTTTISAPEAKTDPKKKKSFPKKKEKLAGTDGEGVTEEEHEDKPNKFASEEEEQVTMTTGSEPTISPGSTAVDIIMPEESSDKESRQLETTVAPRETSKEITEVMTETTVSEEITRGAQTPTPTETASDNPEEESPTVATGGHIETTSATEEDAKVTTRDPQQVFFASDDQEEMRNVSANHPEKMNDNPAEDSQQIGAGVADTATTKEAQSFLHSTEMDTTPGDDHRVTVSSKKNDEEETTVFVTEEDHLLLTATIPSFGEVTEDHVTLPTTDIEAGEEMVENEKTTTTTTDILTSTSEAITTTPSSSTGDSNTLSNVLDDKPDVSITKTTTQHPSQETPPLTDLTPESPPFPVTTTATTDTNSDAQQTEIAATEKPIWQPSHRRPKQMMSHEDEEPSCPCDEPKMTFDPSSCPGERTATDPDCPCRNVCARQAFEQCSSTEPCDAEFGLHCSPDSNTCEGDLAIQKFDVTHNSAKIQWGLGSTELQPQASVFYTNVYRGRHTQWIEVEVTESIVMLEDLQPNTNYFIKVEEDGKQEIAVIRTKDGCVLNMTLSFGVGEKFNLNCNQTCTCFAGGETECHNRCSFLPGAVSDPSCEEIQSENDPCCVIYMCKDNTLGNSPKVLVTQRSPSTLTVVWDDFRLPSYHSEYILEYRLADSADQNVTWNQIQAGSLPIMTINQLKPNTPYQVRVAVWEEGNKKLESPSEIITVYTEDGCIKNNQTYSVGDEFFYGCDLRCICKGEDHEDCSERCNLPYVKAGLKSEDVHCYEKPLPTDPCCVAIRCTEGKSLDLNEDMPNVNKEGECPEIIEEVHSDTKPCLSDCDHDSDCGGNMKCCSSSCGGAVCVQPKAHNSFCENIYCGPNAHCVPEKMTCECMDGFEGNPHNFLNGCKHSDNVHHTNNKTHPSSFPVELDYGDKDDQGPKFEARTEIPGLSAQTDSSLTVTNDLETSHGENKLSATTEASLNIKATSKSSITPEQQQSKFENSETNSKDWSPENEDHLMTEVIETKTETTTENSQSEDDFLNDNEHHDSDNNEDVPGHQPQREDEMMINTTDEEADVSKQSDEEPTPGKPIHFDGCEYNNITYDRGVKFNDGCDARCICDGPGHVSCVPRCSVMSSGGPSCHEVPDPDDICCKIMICSFPGSPETDRIDGLPMKILSAQPQNASSVRIRLMLSLSQNPVMVGRESLEVWFSETSQGNSDISGWIKKPVMLSELMEVQQNIFEFDVNGLMPNTDYYFKVARESQGASALHLAEFSNTVNTKTFPSAVKAAFQGCFHHNQSYNLGEVFYQGCEYKCICREKGFIECQDRCEIYIDTVGYEGCDWVPSEEDPCCTIPSCQRRKIPVLPGGRTPFIDSQENMCVVSSDEVYRIGDIWELDDGCKTKVCRCSMLSNGSTTIQCQSECPSLPPNAHIPSPRCPNPIVIKPDGPCSCPYVACSDAPRRVIQPPRPQCEYKGQRYDMGVEFHDGCLALCHCGQDLRVNCATIECPYHFSSDFTNCLEWDIDPDFVPTPPHCCAPSKCKNDGSCVFSGQKFNNFEDIPAELLPCGSRCVCVNGNVTCENRCPPVEDVPPPHLSCPPALAYKGHPVGETCCLQWLCRESVKRAHCMFQGVRYLPSEQWEVRKGSQRRLCSCHLGPSDNPEVECKGGCPQIPQRFLLPTVQCARPVIVTPDDPVMCPYVVCNNTLSGQELHNVNVVAINSTAVRIRFTLPNILVGLIGHAELHFTTDPTLPPTEWHIQKFSRPKRLFDSPNIEYILNALRPNTTYFLQVKIKIDALQGGPESDLFKLRMPEEIIPTSTTTLPPMIMIDAKPEAHIIDANTVRISWRNFEPQEKKFIYALQLKYKMVNDAEDKWITTPMIHRDVTSYFLHDLEPLASYTIDMVFTAPKGLPTRLVSAKPLEIHTLGKPKDEYDLQVSIHQSEAGSQSSEFSVTGIPEPISKYVHVVKILYKPAGGEQMSTYKALKSSKLMLDHLDPGKRYKAHLELYLTNGRTMTTNEIEFITKAASPDFGVLPDENIISDSHSNGKQAEPLQSSDLREDENRAYFIALVVVAVVAAVAGFGFVLLLVLLVKRQASAKAPISRTPSESAYDNPTYKTYDGERLEEKANGQVIQTTQA